MAFRQADDSNCLTAGRSDADLLAARVGVADAFEAFYRRHSGAVLAYVARRARDVETALDATAEVFAAAYFDRCRYRPELGSARSWLLGIARHKLADAHRRDTREWTARRKLRVDRFHYTDTALEQAEQLIDGFRDGHLRDLADLPAAERDAITARVIEGRPYQDIAIEANTAPATIRKRVSRGLQRLADGRGRA